MNEEMTVFTAEAQRDLFLIQSGDGDWIKDLAFKNRNEQNFLGLQRKEALCLSAPPDRHKIHFSALSASLR